jgi:hypothetical protein
MKKKFRLRNSLLNSAIIILSFSVLLYAYSTGITGVTKKSNNPGCICHGPNPSSDVTVTINGPDTLTLNQTANYSITISGGPLIAAGTDIAVSNGTLAPVSNDLRIQNSELTHQLPKTSINGVVTFGFMYTAPSVPGEQIIYANGNSVNFNGQFTGDQWNFAPNKIIIVSVPSGVENELNNFAYKLEQNYPNPFNPSTKIRYSVPHNELVSLKVYDLLGNEVATLVSEEKTPGNYEITFNTNNISNNFPSGVYFYVLKAGNFSAARKFVLLK